MFTDCPSCERLFRIRAAQLKAADGWVRCGHCAETFYALERLHDAPVKQAPPAHSDTEQMDAPAQPIQPPDDVAVEQQDEAQAEAAAAQQDQPPLAGAEPEHARAPYVQFADEATEPQQEATEAETADAGQDRELLAELAELPPALDYQAEKTTASSSRFIWAGLIIILSMIALAQVAWFNRDRLLREYPALTPWAERLCGRLQCDLIRFRDLSAIKLLNREVRLHPRFRDALLVRATLVNHAEYIQPYPQIELVIYATNGQVISQGRFNPADYLGSAANPAAGMPPGAPIHFVLELAGAAQQAVSFEFQFH